MATTKPTPKTVAVIGGGIGGLTAALALAQSGHEVTVYEQAKELAEIGAGLQLSPNATHVLHALGLTDDLAAIASAPSAICLRDGLTNADLASVQLRPRMVQDHGAPFYQIHRADLIGLLAQKAQDAGAHLVFGHSVTKAHPGGTLAIGGKAVQADCIVAADGIKSDIRTRVFGGKQLQSTGQSAYRMIVPAGVLEDTTTNWLGPGSHVIAYPLRGGSLTNIVAVADAEPISAGQWSKNVELPELMAAFAKFAPSVRSALSMATQIRRWGLFALPPVACLANQRMALIGDAAHPMLPFFAQGAAMAIEDAWVLAAMLRDQDVVENALMQYSNKRMARVTRVQTASKANGGIYHASGLKRIGRNAVLQTSSKLNLNWLQNRQNWLYGYNAVTDL